MIDYSKLFKAVIIPYIACYSFTVMGALWFTGQEIPQMLWVIFFGALGKEGIEFGIKKVKK